MLLLLFQVLWTGNLLHVDISSGVWTIIEETRVGSSYWQHTVKVRQSEIQGISSLCIGLIVEQFWLQMSVLIWTHRHRCDMMQISQFRILDSLQLNRRWAYLAFSLLYAMPVWDTHLNSAQSGQINALILKRTFKTLF